MPLAQPDMPTKSELPAIVQFGRVGSDTPAEPAEGGAEDWKAGRQELAILITLSIISFIIAVRSNRDH